MQSQRPRLFPLTEAEVAFLVLVFFSGFNVNKLLTSVYYMAHVCSGYISHSDYSTVMPKG